MNDTEKETFVLKIRTFIYLIWPFPIYGC